MDKLFLLFIIYLLASCGSLPEDPAPAPIDNFLYTLELRTANRIDLGLNGDFIQEKGFLEFPLYHSGEYRIFSQRCNYEKAVLYSSKQKSVKINYSELTANMPTDEFACIFNIVRFPDDFDKGAQGQFYLLKKEEFEYPTITIGDHNFNGIAWYQFRETVNPNSRFTIHTAGKGTIFYEGCGENGKFEFSGKAKLPIGLFKGKESSCVYTLGIEYENGKKGLAELNFKFFNKEVVSLPFPVIEYKNKCLSIEYRKPVAFVGIGNKIERGVKIRKHVRPDELVYIRAITAKSRSQLLGIKGGQVVWTPTINY